MRRQVRVGGAAALLLGALAACASMPGTDDDGSTITLARLEGHDVTEGRYTSDLLEIAYDEITAQRLWDEQVTGDLPETSGAPSEPGRYGDLSDVDLDTHVLALWSSGASGSCPTWLAGITTTDFGVRVELDGAGGNGDMCTADDNPYRQVIAIPRDAAPDRAALPQPIVGVGVPGEHRVRAYGG